MVTVDKTYKSTCEVIFQLPEGIEAEEASVVGDFNDWDATENPLRKHRKTKRLQARVKKLALGEEYQFRYLVNGTEWHNDPDVEQVANDQGSQNSLLVTPAAEE